MSSSAIAKMFFQREKTHSMRLIDAARQVSETTGSHDFIYSCFSQAGQNAK